MTQELPGLTPAGDLGAVLSFAAQGAGTVLSSTAFGNIKNKASRGIRATLVIANKSGTISVTMTIRRYDSASNSYVDLLSTTAQTANGTTTLVIHPDLTTAANSILKDVAASQMDIKVVSGVGATPAFDGSVGVELLA